MAFNYTVHLQYQRVADDVCVAPLFREAVPLRGVVQGPGVVPTGAPGRGFELYARAPHDLLPENLDSSKSSSCGAFGLPVDCEVDRFTTLFGAMDGVVMTGRTVIVRVRTKYSVRSGFPPPSSQSLVVHYYHVAVGGAETFLGARAMTFITTAYANRSGEITVTRSWGVGERFRVKYIGRLTAF